MIYRRLKKREGKSAPGVSPRPGLARGKFHAVLRCVINAGCKSCTGGGEGKEEGREARATLRTRVKVEGSRRKREVRGLLTTQLILHIQRKA